VFSAKGISCACSRGRPFNYALSYAVPQKLNLATMARHRVDVNMAVEVCYFHVGLVVPELLEDGRVRVDMGEPILAAAEVPTTLKATRDDGSAVAAPLNVAGSEWTITAVSMGNPHAAVYARDGQDVDVRWLTPCLPRSAFSYPDASFTSVSLI
jgi:diaminopimelate epimerase